MRYVLFSTDPGIVEAFESPEAFLPSDTLFVAKDRNEAVRLAAAADMMFVDLISTLDEPNKIAGYEAFHDAMVANLVTNVPIVLISLPHDYDIDFMVGWPDFVFANMPRPVSSKLFRRASTWI